MPEPNVVVAVGICATSGGVFRECYNVMGGVDTVLPVDVYVPGCAARPESIIDGVIQAVDLLEKKRVYMKSMHGRMKEMAIGRAVTADAPEILALQKIVYQNEAEMYDDWSLAPLKQTLEEMRTDFHSHIFIKAVVGGKIIGSVRGYHGRATRRASRASSSIPISGSGESGHAWSRKRRTTSPARGGSRRSRDRRADTRWSPTSAWGTSRAPGKGLRAS